MPRWKSRWQRRDHKRQPKMIVDGRSVLTLADILRRKKEKANEAVRDRE